MSITTTGTIEAGAAAVSDPTPVGLLGEVEAWISDHWTVAMGFWKKAKAAGVAVETFNAEHPEVLAEAKALEAVAPPAAQTVINEGFSAAEHIADMVKNFDAVAAATTMPMSTPKS